MSLYLRLAFRFERSLRHCFSACSTSALGTATMPRVRFVRRSIGVLPGTLIFIGFSFCRAGVAAVTCQHVSGSSLPVNSVKVMRLPNTEAIA